MPVAMAAQRNVVSVCHDDRATRTDLTRRASHELAPIRGKISRCPPHKLLRVSRLPTVAQWPQPIGSFVGDHSRCVYACSVRYSLTLNNDFAADSMADSMAHELSESANDPYGDAWLNPDGTESGDLCVYTHGNYKLWPNGSFHNVKLRKRLYLIQRLWVSARRRTLGPGVPRVEAGEDEAGHPCGVIGCVAVSLSR